MNRLTLATLSLALPLFAQANTSSVFSPEVNAGTQQIEYRSSYVGEDGGAPSQFSHRLHFQHAFNDTYRLRLIASGARSGGNNLSYNYTRLELQQQYLESEEHGWDAALRYELQISDRSGRPDRFRIAWTGKKDITPDWQIRGNLMLGRQFGANPASGVQVETRAQVTRKVPTGGRLGLEMFNDLNETTNFGSFDDQAHQAGPVYKHQVGNLNVLVSYLFGLSQGADDGDFRVHLIWGL
ncbi:MAG: hypothetical protein ACFHX7_18525 [Pseudomonadota bacterium]